jgi:hypothetical protein
VDTAANIPLTAWQQAAIIVLFMLFLGGVWAFVRWLLSWTTKQQVSWQNFMNSQNDNWKGFIREQDALWQKSQEEQTIRECDSLQMVTDSLNKLTDKLAAHDEKVEVRFNQAIQAANGSKRSATKKTGG